MFKRIFGSDTQSDNTPNEQRFLIVGLGNPGREHAQHRHNIGFMVLDRLAADHNIRLSRVQNRSLVGTGKMAGRDVVLVKPQTYMNRSGEAVSALARYYKIPAANVLVIYDELDLPFGTLRLREKGSAGGHNGMRSVIQHLGEEFPRLRLGIGRPPGQMPAAAYVLQDFGREEIVTVEEMLAEAVLATQTFLVEGINLAMSRHNGLVKSGEGEGTGD